MARIGFKLNDIKKGGSLENLYYDQVIITGRKVTTEAGFRVVEIDDDLVSYDWVMANKDVLGLENIDVFVELPASFKTTQCPAWFPNRTGVDENGDEVIKTLGEFQVRGDSLNGLGWVVKIQGQPYATQMAVLNSVETFVSGNPNATGLLVDEARTLLNGPDYTEE
jgi:hypothetical protein